MTTDDLRQAEADCQCDRRSRLVGDGCSVCNPELARDMSAIVPATDEQIAELKRLHKSAYHNEEAWQIVAAIPAIIARLEAAEAETAACINLIPANWRVVSREGGGPENVFGTLALSVNAMTAKIDQLQHTLRTDGEAADFQLRVMKSQRDEARAEVERLDTIIDGYALRAAEIGDTVSATDLYIQAKGGPQAQTPLEKKLAGLEAEIERLRADAERYRWLRRGAGDIRVLDALESVYGGAAPANPTEFDVAIDLAREQEQGNG